MWDTLDLPWQAALEMAWEAYCVGTIPIGAAVADADDNIVARGRNRIMVRFLTICWHTLRSTHCLH
jgi:tRNA(adenine34) deaminase